MTCRVPVPAAALGHAVALRRSTLRLDPTAPTFDGTEDVTVRSTSPSTEIVVNGMDLTVRSGAIVAGDGSTVEIAKAVPDPAAGADHARAAGGARDRRVHLAPRVPRRAQRSAGGFLPLDAITRRRRPRARHRHHAVRGDRRAPGLPVLGRARPQGGVRRHAGRRRRPDRALERARDRARAAPTDGVVRVRFADTIVDVDLPRGVRGRAAWSSPSRRRRRRAHRASLHVPGKAAPGRVRARGRRATPSTGSRDYYGIPYPDAEVRPWSRCPTSRRARWRTSGCVTYREASLLRRPRARDARRAARRRRDGRARARAHVVRRPRDDALVERHLAERGVRDVHGAARVDAYRPDWEVWMRSQRSRTTALEVDALATHAPDRVSRCTRPTTRRHVRHAHVPEGRRDPADAGAVPRSRTCSATASAATSRSTRTANTETHDLWDAMEEATRRAGPPDHGHLDLPGRVPG